MAIRGTFSGLNIVRYSLTVAKTSMYSVKMANQKRSMEYTSHPDLDEELLLGGADVQEAAGCRPPPAGYGQVARGQGPRTKFKCCTVTPVSLKCGYFFTWVGTCIRRGAAAHYRSTQLQSGSEYKNYIILFIENCYKTSRHSHFSEF